MSFTNPRTRSGIVDMKAINALAAAAAFGLSGAAAAQDSAHDSLPAAARQARMDQAYHDHQSGKAGGTVSEDLHEAGHSIHNGLRYTGHAIHNGVRATGHAIHQGVRATGHAIHRGVDATGHAIHRTVDGHEAPQARSASTTTHP